MKRETIRRAVPALALVTMAGTTAAHASTTKSITYKGPTVDMRWGTVQVAIVVKSKKITNVKPSVYVHTDRSVFINEQALPLLKQEVMQAQNANIDMVSGATDTSGAYIQSLQSAVKKAQKAKSLK